MSDSGGGGGGSDGAPAAGVDDIIDRIRLSLEMASGAPLHGADAVGQIDGGAGVGRAGEGDLLGGVDAVGDVAVAAAASAVSEPDRTSRRPDARELMSPSETDLVLAGRSRRGTLDFASLRAQPVMRREEEDNTAPLTGFQVDCADAIISVHAALQLTGDKAVAASNMSDVYLVIAEMVNQLQTKLRDISDPAAVRREIQMAKISVFDSWMQIVREQMTDLFPDGAKAMAELENAFARLFREDFRGRGLGLVSEASTSRATMRSLQHGHASAHALSTLHRDDSGDVRVAEDDGTDGALPDIAPVEVPLKDQFVAGVRKALPGLLPPLHWVPRYAQLGADPAQRHPPASLVRGVWNTLRGDLQGGITAGVLMIPQGIAYAMLAGVPVTLGLYSGFIGTILYAIFGTSRQLNFGPLAMVSLMIRGVLEEHNLMTPEQKAPAAIAMGFIVGIVYLLLGLCRFGFVVNFLSQPVLSGFTSAAAVIIFVSQLPAFFGVHIESSSYAWMVFYRVCAQLGNTHKWTLLVGVLCALQILVMKKLVPSIPGSLLSIVLAIAVSWPVHLAEYGVAVVGTIPAGLHGFAFPWTDEVPMLSLIVDSVPVALVDFMESISVAKTWAAKFEYETDANQELVALGVANTLHSFFGGYPSMGAIGRSAVSGGSGARTSLHNLFTGLTVMVALLVLTPVIYHLPQATLAAVLMTAVFSLIDYEIARVLWRVSKLDLLTLAVCFGLTIIGGVTIGIFVAIVLSLLLTLYRASNPHTCLLGRTPGTVIYRDASRFRKAAVIPNIIIFRFDGHVFFGNTGVLREQLTAAERQLVERGEKLQAVVLDATAITTIDYQGVLAFRELAINYAKRRVLFCVANLDNRALLTFEAAGLLSLIGRDHFFWRVHDAVLAIQSGTLAVTPFVPPPPPPTFLEWARTVRCTREFWIRQLPDFMVTSRGRLRRPCRSDVESDEVSLIGADRQRTDV